MDNYDIKQVGDMLNTQVFKPCVGIISYLPKDINLKMLRINRLNRLLQQIDYIFNVPIMIVAQNWTGISLQEGTTRQPIIIHNFKKGLGINKARQTLREKFLESEFNYLIMFDDDADLRGTPAGGQAYLREMALHPYGFCEVKPSLLKLFAISKPCYELIQIPDGGADDKDPNMRFFEDMYVCRSLKRLYPERRFFFKMSTNLMELSDAAHDEGNTGWHKVYDEPFMNRKWDRHDTGGNTRWMIAHATKETLLNPRKIFRRNVRDPKTQKWNSLDSVELYDQHKL